MVSRKAAIIGGSAFLIAVVVSSVIGGAIYENRRSNEDDSSSNISPNVTSLSQKAVQELCQNSFYQETCFTTLTNSTNSTNPKILIQVTFQQAIERLTNTINQTIPLRTTSNDTNTVQAYKTCEKLLLNSIHDLTRTFLRLDSFDLTNLKIFIDDLKIWLTGALTYQETCLDCFEEAEHDVRLQMHELLNDARELTVNSLALVNEFSKSLSSDGRQLVATKANWTRRNRRLLQASGGTIKPNVVVAKDGSGKYTTINEALVEVPLNNTEKFVIHIKEGVYEEYVTLEPRMKNVMFIGDGQTKTKITGSKSNKGWNSLGTELTATVVIEGDDFIAKDIGFENTAGAIMHQAVALRVTADRSIFYNCQMDGYQDTLYSQTHRQYYRDCTITGTIDFIFGNSEAVFENCDLVIRKPLDEQRKCMVTANGRTNFNETSGFVLDNCRVRADPGYPVNDKTFTAFLGRPWKPYSTTIVMNSDLDSVINPEGWAPWNGSNAHLDTCFYGEVNNKGPSADLSKRVSWQGFKEISLEEAAKYSPREFLGNDFWVSSLVVPLSLQ